MRNLGYGVGGDDSSTTKLKRKDFDLDDVSYDLTDFSASPARKIRRLDAELAPIIEEESEIPAVFQLSQPEANVCGNDRRGVVIEELPDQFENEERAIVLFNPSNTPLLHSPTNFSVLVNPNFIPKFKGIVWPNQSNQWAASSNEEMEQEINSGQANECLAVVPWVPSQLPSAEASANAPLMDSSDDMMEAEETDVATMEVEDDNVELHQPIGMNVNNGLHQWQQQHCLIPQPPQNTSTPIVWFR
ncbi:OLC1v1035914C1 [Oldenlandia corymbosa var. corymbosa]|uniref:OLC1v1035914C1 n=1 Tax=Oldenlandia corymbosa var. corymbosa TaxID=529605 RepID=A0AAV1CXA4_OLDCO|nr:OLC1v1035914C1 [Oldenlandia corymbosa var. corymbosa]